MSETVKAEGPIDTDEVLGNAKIGRYQILVGLMCAGILLVDGYNVAVLSYVAPLLAEDLNVSRAELGPVLSANMFGNILGLLSLSFFSHRFGLKRTAIAAVICFGVAEIGAALSGSLAGLLFFRFLAGIGLAGAMISAVSITGEYFPSRWRSSAVTYIYLGYTLGQMLAGAVAHQFLDGGFAWQAPLIVGGAIAFLYVFLLLRWLPDSPEYLVNRRGMKERAASILQKIVREPIDSARLISGKKPAGKVPVKDLFSGGQGFTTLMFWLAAMMSATVASIMHNWFTTLLVDSGVPLSTAVSTSVFVTAAGIIAGLLVGPLMDRVGPFVVMVSLFFASAIAVLVLGQLAALLLIGPLAVVAFIQGFCGSGLSKGLNAMAVFLYPTALRTAGLGWGLGIGRFGAASGPVIVGFLLHAGWTPSDVFRAIALPLVVGGVALFLAFWMRRKRKAATQEATA